jgi:hypothetical protein
MGCALRLPENDDIAALWHRGFGVGDLVVLFEDERARTSRRMAALRFQPTLAGSLSPGAVR